MPIRPVVHPTHSLPGSMTDMDTTNKAHRRENPDDARPVLLIVEDEQDLQDLLRYNLEREGFHVLTADRGEDALRLARAELPDLILLDLMLPGIDGLQVCRSLKAEPETAGILVVMLTAKSEEADVVTGLELGADDYVTKPFSPRVLLARVRAVLRRHQRETETPAEGESPVIRREDLVIDPERHEVRVAGQPVELTATEFKLLQLLASRPGRVFTRHQIIETVHGRLTAVTDRSVDVQVVMLRRKLGALGDAIQTVRGVGYRFKE